LKVVEKVPVLLDVVEATIVEPRLTVIVFEAANPVPLTVTVLPTEAAIGFTVNTAPAFIVRLVEAVTVPPEQQLVALTV